MYQEMCWAHSQKFQLILRVYEGGDFFYSHFTQEETEI